MSDIVSVQRRISQLDVSPQFDSYSKVVIHVSDDTTYEYGTDTGRTLEFDNPFGSQQMCRDVLQRLQGYQYQPYTADGTILDPAAEIGDALNSAHVYGGIYTRSKTFGRLMKADVSAPQDEEIDHEYKYENPETREFKRAIDDVTAKLEIANDNINAKVSQTGGNNSSFGWTLTASGFSLFSGNKEVLKCDSGGLTVAGNIAGTSGTIGGFTISSSALYTNNMSSMSSTQASGVHLSASGIKLGQNFRVDSSGNLTCANATITGTLNVGGTTITAANLALGASRANSGYSSWNGAAISTSSGGYCYGAASTWNNAKTTSSSCDYFQANTIVGGTVAGRNGGTLGGSSSNQVVIKGSPVYWRSATLVTRVWGNHNISNNFVDSIGYNTVNIYYLGS